MQTTKLRGIMPPMSTPLKGNDCLDREGTVRLTEHLIKRVVLIDNHLLIADFKVLRIKLDRHSLSEQPCYEA